MNNEIKINVPEGMEIDKENSTFECIKFKPKERKLPKTWEEFCIKNPINQREYFIKTDSTLSPTNPSYRDSIIDANVLPSREYAEAMLALCKLIQLRDCYNDGWKPDWGSCYSELKYIIQHYHNRIEAATAQHCNSVLAFKTKELRDTFLNNFRDLIEKAKLLL